MARTWGSWICCLLVLCAVAATATSSSKLLDNILEVHKVGPKPQAAGTSFESDSVDKLELVESSYGRCTDSSTNSDFRQVPDLYYKSQLSCPVHGESSPSTPELKVPLTGMEASSCEWILNYWDKYYDYFAVNTNPAIDQWGTFEVTCTLDLNQCSGYTSDNKDKDGTLTLFGKGNMYEANDVYVYGNLNCPVSDEICVDNLDPRGASAPLPPSDGKTARKASKGPNRGLTIGSRSSVSNRGKGQNSTQAAGAQGILYDRDDAPTYYLMDFVKLFVGTFDVVTQHGTKFEGGKMSFVYDYGYYANEPLVPVTNPGNGYAFKPYTYTFEFKTEDSYKGRY